MRRGPLYVSSVPPSRSWLGRQAAVVLSAVALCLLALALLASIVLKPRANLRTHADYWSSGIDTNRANVVTVRDECDDASPCFALYEDDPRYDCVLDGSCGKPSTVVQRAAASIEPAPAVQPSPPAPSSSKAPAAVPISIPAATPSASLAASSSPLPPDYAALVRDPTLVPPQRPIPGEADITSPIFEDLRPRSINPPLPLDVHSAAAATELRSRLVIAIGCGVYSGGKLTKDSLQLSDLRMFKYWMRPDSFLRTIQTNHVYRFYLAFDHDDPVYEDAAWRSKIHAEFMRIVREEDARRWHPPGYVPGVTIDASALVVTLHWVHCPFSHKPAWAHSDAIMAAYAEGADYAYRPNDDTLFPSAKDWADRFVSALRAMEPITNLGVVGPVCHQGADHILTHDFTHKTHAVVFGFQYPRSLPNWSSDDWITYIYASVGLMRRVDEVVVDHAMDNTNYPIDSRDIRVAALLAAMTAGGESLDAWTKQQYGLMLPRVNYDFKAN